MVKLGVGMGLLRVEVYKRGVRGLRVKAVVLEGLGVVVEDLSTLVRIRSGFFVTREHDCVWVAPFVVQHFCLRTAFVPSGDDLVPLWQTVELSEGEGLKTSKP